MKHWAWNTCEAIKAESTRNCQCLDMLVLGLRHLLLPPRLAALSPSPPFLSLYFCSLLVMKFLACCDVFEQTYSSCLGREIFDLSGINLILMRTWTKMRLFKVLYTNKTCPKNILLHIIIVTQLLFMSSAVSECLSIKISCCFSSFTAVMEHTTEWYSWKQVGYCAQYTSICSTSLCS